MELERCVFLDLEVYLVFHNSLLFIFFNSDILSSIRELFSFFSLNFRIFLLFFLRRIRCSKYKQQGIVKVLISYQMQNFLCSIFIIVTCEAFLINTKILSFFKTFFFHILHLCSEFQSFRYNNKNIFFKLNRSP